MTPARQTAFQLLRAGCPPHARLAGVDIAFHGVDCSAVELVANQFPDLGTEFLAQPVAGRCHVPGDGRDDEVDFLCLALEVGQAAVVSGQDPGLFGADVANGLLDVGEEASFVFDAFGDDEGGQSSVTLAEDALAAGTVSGMGEIEEEVVGQFGGRLLAEFLGGVDCFGKSGVLADAFPGGAVLDRGADALRLLRQPLGDLGNAVRVEGFGRDDSGKAEGQQDGDGEGCTSRHGGLRVGCAGRLMDGAICNEPLVWRPAAGLFIRIAGRFGCYMQGSGFRFGLVRGDAGAFRLGVWVVAGERAFRPPCKQACPQGLVWIWHPSVMGTNILMACPRSVGVALSAGWEPVLGWSTRW